MKTLTALNKEVRPPFFYFSRDSWTEEQVHILNLQSTPLVEKKHLAHRNRSDFAICDCNAHRGTQKSQRFPRQEKAMLHCDLRARWKVASDLRFRAAISEPKTPYFCGISGDLAPSTQKSLAIAIVRFWCAKN